MDRACKGKILTIDNLQKRGSVLPNCCPFCMHDEESIDNIFIHCDFAREVWSRALVEVGMSWAFSEKLNQLVALQRLPKFSNMGRGL